MQQAWENVNKTIEEFYGSHPFKTTHAFNMVDNSCFWNAKLFSDL